MLRDDGPIGGARIEAMGKKGSMYDQKSQVEA